MAAVAAAALAGISALGTARAEPMDFAAIAPLSGRYVGPITCKDFEADWSAWLTRRWEEDPLFLEISIDKTRKLCAVREGRGCGSYPLRALARVFRMKDEGLYRLEGSVPTRLGEIPMLGLLKIAEDPKHRGVMTFELVATSTAPPGGGAYLGSPSGDEGASTGGVAAAAQGRYTVKARGKAFATPSPPGMRRRAPADKAENVYEFLSWEGEIDLPDMRSACKGTSQKWVWLFSPPSSIYDPRDPAMRPRRKN